MVRNKVHKDVTWMLDCDPWICGCIVKFETIVIFVLAIVCNNNRGFWCTIWCDDLNPWKAGFGAPHIPSFPTLKQAHIVRMEQVVWARKSVKETNSLSKWSVLYNYELECLLVLVHELLIYYTCSFFFFWFKYI